LVASNHEAGYKAERLGLLSTAGAFVSVPKKWPAAILDAGARVVGYAISRQRLASLAQAYEIGEVRTSAERPALGDDMEDL